MESGKSGKQASSVPSLKVALIGYGKMGKAVETVLTKRGHEVCAVIDPKEGTAITLSEKALERADVCIDFSHPSIAMDNIRFVTQLQKPLVVGTTGWYDSMDEVEALVKKYQTGLLYSPNFSVGVQLFLKLVAEAALLFDPFAEYDVGGYEAHHSGKADIPSGTAQHIGKELLAHMTRKTRMVFGDEERVDKAGNSKEIHFPSVRYGNVPGTHSVAFDSPADTITLTHTARSRESFAEGAVRAAEWLCGQGQKDDRERDGKKARKEGLFTLEALLKN